MPGWLLHALGLDSASGPVYLALSGIVGDLGIFGAIGVYLRHRNCREPGCWRLGHIRHAEGLSVLLCHVHHERAALAGPAPADPQAALLGELGGLRADVSGLAEAIRASLATKDQTVPPRDPEGGEHPWPTSP